MSDIALVAEACGSQLARHQSAPDRYLATKPSLGHDGAIDQTRRRHADFPAPGAMLATGPAWAWSDFERSAVMIPRKLGRSPRSRATREAA